MFFQILTELCKKNNITVTALVLKLGFSSSSATTWKKNKPSTEALIKISDYFNVSIDYLLGKTEYPTKVDEDLDGIQFALHGEIHDLTDEEKAKILEFIKFTKSQRKDN